MLSKWRWVLLQISRLLWVRAALFAVLGIATALIGVAAERFIPWTLSTNIGADAVGGILTILASSMLTVTTFSLGVMIAAYGAAATNVTPRATKLLMQDSNTHNALAAFIGSFLFSLVGLVTLSAGAYGDRGRVVLFLATLLVIAIVVITILQWIDHLSRLGRVGETTDRVEQATIEAIGARAADPCFGGRALTDPDAQIPAGAAEIRTKTIGYVQHVDVEALSDWAERKEAEIFLGAAPGAFVHPGRVLVWVSPAADEECERLVNEAFDIAAERTFDQDPRFGVSVMAEIASRALSPATNDSGTAIDIAGRIVRVLCIWAMREAPADEPRHPRLWAPPLSDDDLFDDAFLTFARDGAGLVEVQLRLQKSLAALTQMGDEAFKAAARRQSRLALKRAEAAMSLEEDRALVRAAAALCLRP